MIDYLRGYVVHSLPDRLIILVGGVGYGVEVALPVLCKKYKEDEEVKLWIYTHVRPESFRLFGFQTLAEKQTFSTLLSISGIGPRMALAILSTLSVSELLQVILNNRPEALKAVPGIGSRTAEKIIVELKNKAEIIVSHLRSGAVVDGNRVDGTSQELLKASMTSHSAIQDVKSAMVNLGFKEQEFAKVLNQAATESHDFQTLLKVVLSSLSGSKQQAPPGQTTLEDLF